MKLIIKRLEAVTDDELCSVDPNFTVTYAASLVAAHNSGTIDIDNECWFGYKEDYQFAPTSAIAIVKQEEMYET